MPDRKFDLGDYIEVKDRITRFYELYGNGSLVTEDVQLTSEPDGKPRVLVKALAYRNPEDQHPGVGWSWMELPGKTTYTNGSELENTETSAWGRAIASLGILTDKSIASAQEVANKAQDETEPKYDSTGSTEQLVGNHTHEGTVGLGGQSARLEVREGPDGPAFAFRLEGAGGAIPQVVLKGDIARAFLADGDDPVILKGHHASVKGKLYNVRGPQGGSYKRLYVESMKTPTWEYPSPASPVVPPDAAGPSHSEPTAEPSAPLTREQFMAALAENGLSQDHAGEVRLAMFPDAGVELDDQDRGKLLGQLLKEKAAEEELDRLMPT